MLGWLGRAFEDEEFGEGELVIREFKGEDVKVDGGDLIVEEVVGEASNSGAGKGTTANDTPPHTTRFDGDVPGMPHRLNEAAVSIRRL